MTHNEKIEWMQQWAEKHGMELALEGECGFGRECVGVLIEDKYPDYEWHDDAYNRLDPNGELWVPKDAYHKHPCVAVLGRGEKAEEQLYQWLKWFDDNGFKLEVGDVPGVHNPITKLLGQHRYAHMVKKGGNDMKP